MRLFRNATRQDFLPLILLLCCAIVLRALIPNGLMPDLAALKDGRFSLIICHGDFSHSKDPARDTSKEDACVFAPFSHGKLATASPQVETSISIIPVAGTHSLPLLRTVIEDDTKHFPVGARAPPLSPV